MRALSLFLLLSVASGCSATPTEVSGEPAEVLYEGKPMAHWVREVRDLSYERRTAAQEALVAFKEEAVPPLVAMLRDESPRLRRIAAQTLGQLYDDAAPAVPALVEALKDGDVGVRDYAIGALRNLLVYGGGAPAALTALEDAAASDPDKRLREYAAKAVAEVQEAQRKAAEQAKEPQ